MSSKNLRRKNFDDVKEWKKVDIFSSVEQVNVVMVPKQMHGDKEVVKAKLTQLADCKKFDVYDEAEDLGQQKITETWLVVKVIYGKKGIEARRASSNLPSGPSYGAYISQLIKYA